MIITSQRSLAEQTTTKRSASLRENQKKATFYVLTGNPARDTQKKSQRKPIFQINQKQRKNIKRSARPSIAKPSKFDGLTSKNYIH